MTPSQKRSAKSDEQRVGESGMTRFDVLGLDADRDLIRSLARRLAEGDAEAARIRAAIGQAVAGRPSRKGGILEALRRSPLVGADLDLKRSHEQGRKIAL